MHALQLLQNLAADSSEALVQRLLDWSQLGIDRLVQLLSLPGMEAEGEDSDSSLLEAALALINNILACGASFIRAPTSLGYSC